jgi:hypothetical protein
MLSGEGKLLRIHIGESDRLDHKPLYEAIVMRARKENMAGATVLRGIEGFGAVSRVIHTAKILRLSEDLPVIVEIVDTAEKIDRFTTIVNELMESSGAGGMVTVEKATILSYTHGKKE